MCIESVYRYLSITYQIPTCGVGLNQEVCGSQVESGSILMVLPCIVLNIDEKNEYALNVSITQNFNV
jgi:hypothetical protein